MEIHKGVYRLLQASILAKKLLKELKKYARRW
jgi:hypothetical protein